MLPIYQLRVVISTGDMLLSQEDFAEQIAPCLAYLDALKGSFDRIPCTKTFHPPSGTLNGIGEAIGWSVEAVVSISLGKQRALYLTELFQAISNLIAFELPEMNVEAEGVGYRFDK